LNFITETDMATGVLGVENVQKYKIDSNTNQLILIKDKTGEKTPTYIIHELDEKHMIVSHVKEGMLLYMVKE